MKHSLHLLWLIPLLAASGTALAGDHLPQTSHKPLRPVSKCLNAASINEWHVINDTTITARNGPRYYLIKTAAKCPRLGKYGAGLFFHPSHGKMGAFRICGDLGETVSSRDQPPCAIQSVKLISKKQFETIDKRAQRSGSGAEQPTLPSNNRH